MIILSNVEFMDPSDACENDEPKRFLFMRNPVAFTAPSGDKTLINWDIYANVIAYLDRWSFDGHVVAIDNPNLRVALHGIDYPYVTFSMDELHDPDGKFIGWSVIFRRSVAVPDGDFDEIVSVTQQTAIVRSFAERLGSVKTFWDLLADEQNFYFPSVMPAGELLSRAIRSARIVGDKTKYVQTFIVDYRRFIEDQGVQTIVEACGGLKEE